MSYALYYDGKPRVVSGRRNSILSYKELVIEALLKKGSASGVYPFLLQRGYKDGPCVNPFEILKRGDRDWLWWWFNIWDEDTVFSQDRNKDRRVYEILKPYLAPIACPNKSLRGAHLCGTDCSRHEAIMWMVDKLIHTVSRSETIYDFAPHVDHTGSLSLNNEPDRYYRFFNKLYTTYACILSDALQAAVYDGVTVFDRRSNINQEIHLALYFVSSPVPSGYIPTQPMYI